jgi:uroporphyrinogen decarboxylase
MFTKTQPLTTTYNMNNKLLINVLNKSYSKKIPIWLMRQAGRYLPEYMAIRKNVKEFLDLCYDPELAAKITMQPIERFGFDAAILFSDILVVPHSLGIDVRFEPGEGPKLEIISEKKLSNTISSQNNFQFQKVFETIKNVKKTLGPETTLIGFAGAPWTVATYMIEGTGAKNTNFAYSKFIIKCKPEFSENLIDIITEQTILYLLGQIDAGAEVIQLFDTWAGVLEG